MFFGRQSGCTNLSMDKARLELENDKSINLIDVRTPEEYRAGHIPGSRNIPLDRIRDIDKAVPDRDAKLFVYCLSGPAAPARVRISCGWGTPTSSTSAESAIGAGGLKRRRPFGFNRLF